LVAEIIVVNVMYLFKVCFKLEAVAEFSSVVVSSHAPEIVL
jgi:hypothetical protein